MMMRLNRFLNLASRNIDPAELDARCKLLMESRVFSAVPDEELRMLATMFEEAAFATDDVLFRVGDPADHMFLIGEGLVDVQLKDGTVVNHLESGSVVGEYGMFGSHLRTATIVARRPTRGLKLDYQRFHRFLLAFPEAAVALLGDTVQRMTALMQDYSDKKVA